MYSGISHSGLDLLVSLTHANTYPWTWHMQRLLFGRGRLKEVTRCSMESQVRPLLVHPYKDIIDKNMPSGFAMANPKFICVSNLSHVNSGLSASDKDECKEYEVVFSALEVHRCSVTVQKNILQVSSEKEVGPTFFGVRR